MPVADATSLLDAHLNVHWLRPESALWDAIASAVVSQAEFRSPSLDLGSGNGLFSFITAGGRFSQDYDWYRNAEPDGWQDGRDIYDAVRALPTLDWVIEEPRYRLDWALDAKATLLAQAKALGWYRQTVLADANARWPFPDEAFQTVFSNILSWLDSAEASFKEIRRVLKPGGRAWLCLPDHAFLRCCASYRWRELNSEWLRLLNRGRREHLRWTISDTELAALARAAGLRVVSDARYLSPLTLRAWDIGLRPLSPVLVKLVQRLSEPDRRAIKSEWVELLRPFLTELYEMDRHSDEPGGYHCVSLEKT